MRSAQKQNRSRGRGGRKPNGSNLNRVYESAGPEGKVRGTPQQIIDKYLMLARDAQTSGDRVVAENFLQHAEHYQRILLEAMGARAERRDHPSDLDQPDFDGADDEMEVEVVTPPLNVVDVKPDSEVPQHARRRPHRHQAPEVSGLTTIDAADGGESLLVDAEDLSASQPRRRRRPHQDDAAPGQPDAESQPE